MASTRTGGWPGWSGRLLFPPKQQHAVILQEADLIGYVSQEHKVDGSHGAITADSVTINPNGTILGPDGTDVVAAADAFAVQHKPDGTHGAVTADSLTIHAGGEITSPHATVTNIVAYGLQVDHINANLIYRAGYTPEQGVWTVVPYNAANFGADAGTWTVAAGDIAVYQYTIVGRTMTLAFTVGGTLSTTPTALFLKIPGGYVCPTAQIITPVTTYNGGPYGFGQAVTSATAILIYTATAAPWLAGPVQIRGQITFNIS